MKAHAGCGERKSGRAILLNSMCEKENETNG